MTVRSSIQRVLLSGLLLVHVLSGSGLAAPLAPGVPPGVPAQDRPASVEDLLERVRAEQVVLDDLLGRMIAEDRLYARLTSRQVDRAVGLSEAEELLSTQQAQVADLRRDFFPAQAEAERMADLAYDIGQSVETLDDLRATIREERAIVGDLRTSVRAENATLERLRTPLETALERQRRSQLNGLATLNETLVEQESLLASARRFQVERRDETRRLSLVWRELETVDRNRALANISADYARVTSTQTLRDSRFESQRLGVALLWEHHRARMATVGQYRALLSAMERELESIGSRPAPDEVSRLRQRLTERTTEIATVRDALANESAVASELRAEMGSQARFYEQRAALLEEQRRTLNALRGELFPARVDRKLRTLEAALDAETAVIDQLQVGVDRQQPVVTRLYDVGTGLGVDQRLLAYLRVRDRIADLLEANLDRQEQLLAVQRREMRVRNRAVARLNDATGMQDLQRQLPWVTARFETARLDAAVLRDRFQNQQEVVDWLGEVRIEADVTLESEQALVRTVRADLEAVGTETPPPTRTTRAPVTTTSDPAAGLDAPLAGTVLFVGLLGVVLLVLLLASGERPARNGPVAASLGRRLEPVVQLGAHAGNRLRSWWPGTDEGGATTGTGDATSDAPVADEPERGATDTSHPDVEGESGDGTDPEE